MRLPFCACVLTACGPVSLPLPPNESSENAGLATVSATECGYDGMSDDLAAICGIVAQTSDKVPRRCVDDYLGLALPEGDPDSRTFFCTVGVSRFSSSTEVTYSFVLDDAEPMAQVSNAYFALDTAALSIAVHGIGRWQKDAAARGFVTAPRAYRNIGTGAGKYRPIFAQCLAVALPSVESVVEKLKTSPDRETLSALLAYPETARAHRDKIEALSSPANTDVALRLFAWNVLQSIDGHPRCHAGD